MPTVEEIADAAILRVQPGDVIVLKTQHPISQQQAALLKEAWKRNATGPLAHVQVLVLDNGTDVAILRHEQVGPPPTPDIEISTVIPEGGRQ